MGVKHMDYRTQIHSTQLAGLLAQPGESGLPWNPVPLGTGGQVIGSPLVAFVSDLIEGKTTICRVRN